MKVPSVSTWQCPGVYRVTTPGEVTTCTNSRHPPHLSHLQGGGVRVGGHSTGNVSFTMGNRMGHCKFLQLFNIKLIIMLSHAPPGILESIDHVVSSWNLFREKTFHL